MSSQLKRSREDVTADEGAALPTLYGYWRSSATWRVRIACEFKKIPYLYHPINLLKKEECSEAYTKINPMGQLPSWVQPRGTAANEKKAKDAVASSASSSSTNNDDDAAGDIIINQSMAILEYLDEAYPSTPQLLPAQNAEQRAAVRDLALLVVSGIHPLQNNVILAQVDKLAGAEAKGAWAKDVISEGFDALEKAIISKRKNIVGKAATTSTTAKFCFGDSFTLADACLIPQLYNASRFGVDVNNGKYPTIAAIVENYKSLDFLAAAHPDAMPDATL